MKRISRVERKKDEEVYTIVGKKRMFVDPARRWKTIGGYPEELHYIHIITGLRKKYKSYTHHIILI